MPTDPTGPTNEELGAALDRGVVRLGIAGLLELLIDAATGHPHFKGVAVDLADRYERGEL
jgi:hypothetical protein